MYSVNHIEKSLFEPENTDEKLITLRIHPKDPFQRIQFLSAFSVSKEQPKHRDHPET